MKKIRTFTQVIGLFGYPAVLAAKCGVSNETVRAWRRRGIPGYYWVAIAKAAKARRIEGITVELLAQIASRDAPRRIANGRKGTESRVAA